MRKDSKLAISLARNLVSHGRRKYIKTKFHFFKEQVEKHKLELTYYNIDEQVANLFTKPLKFYKLKGYEKCLACIRVRLN